METTAQIILLGISIMMVYAISTSLILSHSWVSIHRHRDPNTSVLVKLMQMRLHRDMLTGFDPRVGDTDKIMNRVNLFNKSRSHLFLFVGIVVITLLLFVCLQAQRSS